MVAGVEAAHEAADAYFFVLGDQPLLTPRIVNDMISLYETSQPDALVVAPAFEGRRGNPTLFSAALKDELLQTSGDAGGRGIIQRLEKEFPQKNRFSPPAQ